ncbi:MAG TPA: YibE/F family protein, partial [Acidimicrobiia bacterium]|nr:YibE/F family protein [Acidimicrobiia bacterium]
MAQGQAEAKEAARARARARFLLLALVVPLLAATVLGLVVLWPADSDPPTPDFMGGAARLADATVVKVDRHPCGGADPGTSDPASVCQRASVKLTDGAAPGAGTVVEIEVGSGADTPDLHGGDKIVVGRAGGGEGEGGLEGDGGGWYFADYQRRGPLVALAVFFACAVVVFGRWRGLFALAGLAVAFAVLVRFVLPAILIGKNPVAVAVIGSAAIMFASLYLTHGINARATTAVLGTVGALFVTGALAWIFVAGTHLTGMATEESGLLAASVSGVSLRGLLLAGIVIGSLGVLDNVAVTQASAVWELHRSNPEYRFNRLYAAGLRLGRDHVASSVNSLAMAYAGASLPLLVLFTLSSRRLGDVLTGEILAQEIVRTLVGSIGLLSAVPITTALAAFVADRSLHREPVPALVYDGDGSLSQLPA